MQQTKYILALGAVLIWVFSSGIASADYYNWSEPGYDNLVSADSSATIPPGTRITMQNWQQYKNFMPIGMQQLWAGKFFWHLPQNAAMVVQANTPIPLPQQYRADTEKYSGQVKLVQNSNGGYNIQGYVAGAPFPNPEGPLAGVQVMYDEYYAYIPYLITTYAHPGVRYGPIWEQVRDRGSRGKLQAEAS